MGTSRRVRVGSVAAAAALLFAAIVAAGPVPLASAATGAVEIAPVGAHSYATVDVSADGRYVAFDSTATTLGSGEDAGSDVFVYDRVAKTTELISVRSDGGDPAEDSGGGWISDDGRYVVFDSLAPDLVVSDDDDHVADVYVRDRLARTTELVSTGFPVDQGPAWEGGGGGDISGDGTTAAFMSLRSFEGTDCAVFVRDLVHDVTKQTNCAGEYGAASFSLSDDGSLVAVSGEGGAVIVRPGASPRTGIRMPQPRNAYYFRDSVLSGDGRHFAYEVEIEHFLAGGGSVITKQARLWSNGTIKALPKGLPVAISDHGGYVALAPDRILDTKTGVESVVPSEAPCSEGAHVRALSDDGSLVAYVARRRSGSGYAVYVAPRPTTGYRLAAADGGVFTFGSASYHGSMGGTRLVSPIVGMASTKDDKGYWLVAGDGGLFAFGSARFHGSMGGTRLNSPIVGMAPTSDGRGYWMVAADGGVFAFGSARFRGSMGGTRLVSPIVGMAPTSDGRGYWLVAADGGVFAFGSARFRGSMGGARLVSPIAGIAAAGDDRGYVVAGADGGVFAFGSARYRGSAAGRATSGPVVGLRSDPATCGYTLASSDGAVFPFAAGAAGSLRGVPLRAPIVAIG